MHLVLLETSGNQDYIFATNRLAQNVGATHLTHCATTWEAIVAAEEMNGTRSSLNTKRPFADWRARDWVADPMSNPAIESAPERNIEIILATSGKCIALARTRELGREFVTRLTLAAARGADGVDLLGVVGAMDFNFESSNIHAMLNELHREFERVRSLRPGGRDRHFMLPLLDRCEDSGAPAHKLTKRGADARLLGHSAAGKMAARDEGFARIESILGLGGKVKIPSEIDEIGESWIGLLFGDANGMGQVILNFNAAIADMGRAGNRFYLDTYRRFSAEVEESVEAAFRIAAKASAPEVDGKTSLPIIPIVLGGDDMTALCAGSRAFDFAIAYLREFERQTREKATLKQVAKKLFGVPYLSMALGLVLVKPHFPFHAAHGLANELLSSAKQVKREVMQESGGQAKRPLPASAFDFLLYHHGGSNALEGIRGELIHTGARLFGGPYITTDCDEAKIAEDCQVWYKAHRFEKLRDTVRALRATADGDEDRRLIPTSHVHELRFSLFSGRDYADAVFRRLNERTGDGLLHGLALQTPGTNSASLFQDDGNGFDTILLDALDASELWAAEGDGSSSPAESRGTLQ